MSPRLRILFVSQHTGAILIGIALPLIFGWPAALLDIGLFLFWIGSWP